MNRIRFSQCVLGGFLALGLAATAHADLRTTYQAGPIVYPGANADYPQQSAVNKNIGSPYYGYVYIADYRGVAAVPKMIHIWKPVNTAEGTGAAEYVDSGLEIATPDMGQYDPFAVAVGPDDTVWIGEFTSGVIATAPPVPPTGTSVTATPQITGVGSVRGLTVVGPITSAQLYLTGTTTYVSKYTGSAPDVSTQGTFTQVYNTAITGLNSGPYGSAVDLDGNLYIVTKTNAPGTAAFIKLDATGVVVPFPAVIPPNYFNTSDLSSAGFVADKTYPGGGYLYSINRTSTTAGDMGIRYDLSGNYLDGYGPAKDPAPANYSVVALARNNTYGTTDDLGNVIQKVSFGGNGAYQKVIKRAPYVVAAADATSAAAPVKSSPTAVDGVVYFGTADGKLCAYTTADGNPVSGFPVDISAAVGATVQVLGRPSVYFGAGGKAIYLTTNRGDVVKVMPDGALGWIYSAFAGTGISTATAPAVTPDGVVIAAIVGANGLYVLKLDQATGAFQGASLPIGLPAGNVSSPAVEGSKVYVGAQGGTTGDLVVLNLADLAVLASFAGGEGVVAPPHVKGPDAYVGTLAGNLYKVNSANLSVDPGFGAPNGTPGRAAIGEPLVTDAFPHAGALYVGSNKGKVWDVSLSDGAFTTLYDTTDAAAVVGGLVVNPESGTIAFGTSSGIFYQVPAGVHAAQVFRGYGAFAGTPTYDRATGRFLIGSDDQNVYAFSSR